MFVPVQSPEAPQKTRLESGSMHVPPQLTWPVPHETWQAPPVQTCPDGHVVPASEPVQAPDAPQN